MVENHGMAKRHALLVGSLPYGDEEAAMRKALDALGDQLFSLPDGEIGIKDDVYKKGRRIGWVQTAIQRNVDSGLFDVVKDVQRDEATGLFRDYTDLFVLRPRHKPGTLTAHLNFGYLEFFRRSYPTFRRLREQPRRSDLVFQVGVPTGLAIGLLSMRPLQALRYRRAFDERLATEVNKIVKVAGDDVIIQLEIPIEMGLAQRLPSFLMRLPVGMIVSLVNRIDARARLGVHMCLGDLHNKALVKLDMEGLIVRFANRLTASWPSGRRLEYVHVPLAEGEVAPPTDPAAYAPLQRIRLPDGTRLVAGFVHEKLTLDEHTRILEAIEAARGGSVAVACSCGMGRRTPEVADRLLELTRRVAEA
jgi:hypothetical protein